MKKLLLCISALVFLFQGTTKAQLVDVIHEVAGVGPAADPFFGNPLPAGYTAYRIYARLEDPTDRLSAVFGSTAPSPIHNLRLWSTNAANSIFNNAGGGYLGESGNCALFGFAPALQFDSYVTIGQTSSCVDCVGVESGVFSITNPANQIPGSFGGGALGPDLTITDGSWFLPNDGSCNGFGQGADHRVLIAQVTVPTGTLEYWLNISVFDEAIGANQMIYVHTQQDDPGMVGPIAEIDGNCIGLVFPEPAECSLVPGCMDITACNYNPAATVDDGSCTYPGCNDVTACNYDATAGCNDGSCTYPGCTDPLATNFDPTAGCDDGSCTYPTPGCIDPTACNFDPSATIDDGSCCYGTCAYLTVTSGDFPSEVSWSIGLVAGGAPVSDVAVCIDGCFNTFNMNDAWGDGWNDATYTFTDAPGGGGNVLATGTLASGFAGSANIGELGCGCTDPAACNYDPTATTDDGSCLIAPANDQCSGALVVAADASIAGDNTSSCVDGPQPTCGFGPGPDLWYSFTYNGGTVVVDTDLGSISDTRLTVYDGCGGAVVACNDDSDGLASQVNLGCGPGFTSLNVGTTYYVQASGYNGALGTFTVNFNFEDIHGCCDPAASNYDACANVCDVPCDYFGCTNPLACNFNPAATDDDGSCCLDNCITLDITSGDFPSEIGWEINGNVGGAPFNGVLCLPTGCLTFNMTDAWGDGWNDAVYTFTDQLGNVIATGTLDDGTDGSANIGVGGGTGCMDPGACNYDATAVCDDGSCTYPGCNDINACNYDATAGCDDGSCTYPGCTIPGACNYDATAGCDDGSCTFPGCTDATACNYDPTAGCDDGSCIASGCTDPLACNFDAGAGCDDGSCTYPPCIANDVPAGAIALATSPLGVCNPTMDDLTGASDSPESITVGPDLWYSFVAVTSGIRIQANDLAPQNLAIEIVDAGMNPVDLENVVGGNGDEALNYGGLTAGNTYYISVSNVGGVGAGTFSICVQWLPDTRCDYGPGPYSLCGTFKADWIGANGYAFHFTSQTTLLTYSKTQASPTPGTFCVLNTVPGLAWGDTYDVTIGAVWNLLNGAGATEAIEVLGDEPCFIIVTPQPLMVLRPSDNCANHGPHFMGSTIAGQPFVCGAVDFEWTFTRTDVPELPIVHLRGAANRFLTLTTVPGLTPGGTYDVKVRPIFASAPSVYGATSCISIVGPAGMVADNNGATVEHAINDKVEEETFEVGLYPNPNNGELINVNLTNIESDIVKIDMFDMYGKLVYRKQFAVEGVLNTILTFDEPLAGGVYMVNIIMDGKIQTERMVVER